ncbi:exported hypothetical protein [Candidatus Sulfotelmatomonas gaucii]|uniref:Uncharacterized protein n=1 Tax=Candidatus Sulfuritelmatomonas gaucii TaxID=2043161 RepID=A0A2N9LLM0_9BACT|nr:exported hypothetical protein [Candidatus Sulfotelmatomonas gaucii]
MRRRRKSAGRRQHRRSRRTRWFAATRSESATHRPRPRRKRMGRLWKSRTRSRSCNRREKDRELGLGERARLVGALFWLGGIKPAATRVLKPFSFGETSRHNVGEPYTMGSGDPSWNECWQRRPMPKSF